MKPAWGPPARKLSVSFIGLRFCAETGIAIASKAVSTAPSAFVNIVFSYVVMLATPEEQRADASFTRRRSMLDACGSCLAQPRHEQPLEQLHRIAEQDTDRGKRHQHGKDQRHVQIAGSAQQQIPESCVGADAL